MELKIAHTTRVVFGEYTYDVQESETAPQGTVIVRDSSAFLRFLQSAVATPEPALPDMQVIAATAKASLEAAVERSLPYTLPKRQDTGLNPVWARQGTTREVMAQAIFTRRKRLSQLQWEVAQAYIGIDMTPMRHDELAITMNRKNTPAIFRDALRVVGIVPKDHKRHGHE